MIAEVQPYAPIGRERLGGLISRATVRDDHATVESLRADLACERAIHLIENGGLRPEHVAALRLVLAEVPE